MILSSCSATSRDTLYRVKTGGMPHGSIFDLLLCDGTPLLEPFFECQDLLEEVWLWREVFNEIGVHWEALSNDVEP